jgi:anthranilate synthase/aminodeoxychorismate synthase-like glutamine amidotransferase
VRNTSIDVDGVRKLRPDALVFSPGPCTPSQAGFSIELIRAFADTVPILGVCLGHQAIAEAFGGKIARAKEPVHGRTSLVYHDGRGVFSGISSPLVGCRYHSLVVEENALPPCLEVSARTEDRTVMALRHRHRPIVGLQFHPESILTATGYSLLANFLELSNLRKLRESPTIDSELAEPTRPILRPPRTPIPF